ncbi:sugar phosphate isomerase/epimerase family protein [Vallitalea guaymasensis]|uniref:sugar phosphate isomerase/epimerase family protein n=1 Tax=Vallitalea guaymasensis TaxID=1185412 RepID=UPI000DE38336|nr:sugar phosphate isomerase/epimerase [Vallitalea guaymasensis]
MKYNFSCSTSWNGHKAQEKNITGYDILNEIKDLGFDQVELNYNVTEQTLREMYPLLETGEIKVSSLHNVFPKASEEYGPSSILLGFEDQYKRKQAIDYTIRTIEYAKALGAKGVVIHSSKIVVCPEDDEYYNKELRRVFLKYGMDSKEYKDTCNVAMAIRQKKSKRQTELIIESLEEICDYMFKKNIHVKLGLENRAMYHEMPDEEEYRMIFDRLTDEPVYVWYDIGHGEMLNQLGVFDGFKVLRKYRNKLLGVHIHDVDDRFLDHLAPYSVSNKLDNYLDIIDLAPIKVLELSKNNTSDMIKTGVEQLENKLDEL